MWLPAQIYERLPVAYTVTGVLFFAGTFYIGLESSWADLYLSLGLFSILAGVVLSLRRRTERAKLVRNDDIDLDTDSI